mmetsp:Transcript_1298/g.1948  ORF Transcript_1298/g.1948 Transcript_1298/m.1948 type:complete len:120 (+) Transcript_1298:6-365(+)
MDEVNESLSCYRPLLSMRLKLLIWTYSYPKLNPTPICTVLLASRGPYQIGAAYVASRRPKGLLIQTPPPNERRVLFKTDIASLFNPVNVPQLQNPNNLISESCKIASGGKGTEAAKLAV